MLLSLVRLSIVNLTVVIQKVFLFYLFLMFIIDLRRLWSLYIFCGLSQDLLASSHSPESCITRLIGDSTYMKVNDECLSWDGLMTCPGSFPWLCLICSDIKEHSLLNNGRSDKQEHGKDSLSEHFFCTKCSLQLTAPLCWSLNDIFSDRYSQLKNPVLL